MRIALLVCLITLACSLIFVACDSGNNTQTPSTTNEETTIIEETTEKHICSFGEWTTVKEATCTEKGEQERSCACGEKETQNIDALGHTEVVDEAIEPTCTETGLTEGKHCSVCEEILVAQETVVTLGHTEVIDAAVAPTCTETGLTEGKHCSVCETVITEQDIVNAIGHTFDNSTVTKEPDCINKGSEKATCQICGETQTFDIDALGHTVNNGTCTKCGLQTMDMTNKQIENSQKVASMSHTAYNYSDGIEINISFADEDGYSIQAPAYVKIRIDDANGNTVFEKTLIMKDSQDSVSIDFSEFSSYTTTGTIYYTVFNDYFYFDEISYETENMPWTVIVDVPELPANISYYGAFDNKQSTCKVTNISFEISRASNTLILLFTGEKTYDVNGNNYSDSCYVGWKLYDEEGYVVASGTLYTDTLAVGEKFKNAESLAYDCIEPGETYTLEILNVKY